MSESRSVKPFRSALSPLLCLLLGLLALPSWATDTPTVAVLYFDYEGENAEMKLLKKGLAQMLISDLSAQQSIRLVERDRLQQVLDELKLGKSDKVDAATANQVGKLLGARYLVMGGYFDVMNTLRVDARVVETETGRIIRSVGTVDRPDRFLDIEQTLAQELRAFFGDLTARDGEPGQESTKPARPQPKPRKLTTKTALRYARALDAKDRKDLKTAKQELRAVVKEQPDFLLASADLAQLMK